MSWRAELDALKRMASAQTRSTTADAQRILDALGTSIPDVRTGKVTKDDVESFYAAARNLGIDRWWAGGHVWHLSASLHRKGRSTTVNDWKMLGHFAMHLGAPKDSMIMPEDPTRVVHWQWPEAA